MERRVVLAGFLAFCCAPRAAAEETAQLYFEGPKTTVLPLMRSPDGKLYLTARLNDRDVVLFVDSGATSIIDLRVANDLGLSQVATGDKGYGLNGGISDRITTRADLRLGKLILKGVVVDVVDMSSVQALSRQHGLPEFDGLIGSELLWAFKARIDYAKLTLTLTRPGLL